MLKTKFSNIAHRLLRMVCCKSSIATFALVFAAHLLFAQGAIKDMERKKQQVEKDISYTNSLITKTKEQQQSNLDNLKLVKVNLDARKTLIKNIDTQLIRTIGEISYRQKKTSVLYDDLEQLKENYAQMIKFLYRNKNSYSQLMYILASEDINQAYRRLSYLKTYSDNRIEQAKKIAAQSELLNTEIETLQKKKQEQEYLLNQKSNELQKLNTEEQNYEKLLSSLKSREKELLRDLNAKRQRSIQLDQQIQQIIAEEARKEEERRRKEEERRKEAERKAAAEAAAAAAAEAAKKKAAKTEKAEKPVPAPEPVRPAAVAAAKPVVSDFEKQKGTLPRPVQQGVVVTKFGVYDHPVIQGIRGVSNGIDISTNLRASVRVVADGIVRRVFSVGGITSILVQHGIYYTIYTHLDNLTVAAGDMVRARQSIATVDAVDNRAVLHFELWKQTEKQDPEQWLSKSWK